MAGSDASAVDDLLDVLEGTDSFQERNSVSGPLVGLKLILDDQRDLGDSVDPMSPCEHQRNDATCSDGGGCSVSLLLDVHSSVPPPPGPERSEHAPLPAHVTESTLTASVGTASGDSWNTGHGSSCAPGLGTMLHTSLNEDTMCLSSVSSEVLVDEANNIRTDRCSEDSREWNMLLEDLVGVVNAED